ncbi:Hypothetical protein SMAX5B_009212 [Scophthalmus maximus]|uniref:Uncharacterized protein n=1 Tax=Scophthalmus maximus TaxID=52904 RepID=A0A2U9C1G6_SCOMX|nr:Hypothetical protein SMAX5B_009212 [Scophthalmus maximus]KAF0041657.1 hypothetical protein F2P81_005189 [Scophthalmus maximus]
MNQPGRDVTSRREQPQTLFLFLRVTTWTDSGSQNQSSETTLSFPQRAGWERLRHRTEETLKERRWTARRRSVNQMSSSREELQEQVEQVLVCEQIQYDILL